MGSTIWEDSIKRAGERALTVLRSEGECTTEELADKCWCSAPMMGSALGRLEKESLVHWSPVSLCWVEIEDYRASQYHTREKQVECPCCGTEYPTERGTHCPHCGGGHWVHSDKLQRVIDCLGTESMDDTARTLESLLHTLRSVEKALIG
jgi:hypothetical protein